jgi:phosphoribosylformylglycinamidine synthase
VPQKNVEALRSICDEHDVDMCDLGHFGVSDSKGGAELVLRYRGTEVGRLPMDFLHDGLPEVMREAAWSPSPRDRERQPGATREATPTIERALLSLLAHPNIASKHWIIRQYDHEVQGGSVIKPLVGRGGDGPSDAAALAPVAGSNRGLGIACGLATGFSRDPYVMTLNAIDECVRNLVCVGVDPARIAILDNFCWPSCADARNLGELVRAAEACYDGAKAYRTPFISGKDSLNNQFTMDDGRTIQIPPTLLISGMGIIEDVRRCVTMDAKKAGNVLMLVGEASENLCGSHFEMVFGDAGNGGGLPRADLTVGPAMARTVHKAILAGLVSSAHDVSDGGILVAAAEMALAGGLGLKLDALADAAWFSEAPSRYLLEVEPRSTQAIEQLMQGSPLQRLGSFDSSGAVSIDGEHLGTVDELKRAWRGTLDW